MSSGTFSLMPGPASVGTDATSFAGTQTAGLATPGTQLVSILAADVAARIAEAPMAIVQLAYTRAAREFCRRSMWLKRNIATSTLTVGQPVYNFGTDATLEVIGIQAVQIQQQNATWIDLREGTQDSYDPNMSTDLPNWYSYVPEGMILYYPTPNYAYGTKVELIVQTAIAATTIPNDLVTKFNTHIEEGALWHLYRMKKQPWSDMELAMDAERLFNEGIGIARSWKDKGNQKGSVRATPRPFLAR
jgi:hypothetical protein